MHLDGTSVEHVTQLKVLGIIIDENRLLTSHFTFIKAKLQKLYLNSHKITSHSWGVHNNHLRLWYTTIIERILLYGAGAWGTYLTKQAKLKALSAQRLFLLQISRGYRTISTDALHVITGIPPITLKIELEYTKSRILHFNDAHLQQECFQTTNIQQKPPSWQLHPAADTTPLLVDITKNSNPQDKGLQLYTDGSKTESGVGSAFCAMLDNQEIHRWSCRLEDYNTVFQAELFAIHNALSWSLNNHSIKEFNINTDSLSSLYAIRSDRAKHPAVLQIKLLIKDSPKPLNICLKHVKAHSGVRGNEIADTLAKEATTFSITNKTLNIPPSYIKRSLKEQLMKDWQQAWDTSNKGRYTYGLIPKVSDKLLSLSPSNTAFLTGHGPFRQYLHRFKISIDDKCECGELASPQHYYYSCPLTSRWHIKYLPKNKRPSTWLVNILSRKTLQDKLREIYLFLQELSNLT